MPRKFKGSQKRSPVILRRVTGLSREEVIIGKARRLLGAKFRDYSRFSDSAKNKSSISQPDFAYITGIKAAVQADDCAIWTAGAFDLLVTTDMLVENTHFIIESGNEKVSLFDAGLKALSVNVSDVAACGGEPLGYVVSLGTPASADGSEIEAFTRGIRKAAKLYDAEIWGGDLVASRDWTICITVVGAVEKGRAVLRSGASAGDLIAVSGDTGLAATGMLVSIPKMAALRRIPPPDAKRFPKAAGAFKRPIARVELGRIISQGGFASAMIDTSDSIAKSARLIARASGLGATLDFSEVSLHPEVKKFLKISAETTQDPKGKAKSGEGKSAGDIASGGPKEPGGSGSEKTKIPHDIQFLLDAAEDYELLFAIRPGMLQRLKKTTPIKISVIGEFTKARGIRVRVGGKLRNVREGGFEHFA